jgi:hypothetical protein
MSLRLSPSALKTFGYELQSRADEHNGVTVPPYERVTSMLIWLGTFPRMPEVMRPSATWQEGNVTHEMTAILGPRGGISDAEAGQGVQLRVENSDTQTVYTADIRVTGITHTTTILNSAPEIVHDEAALQRLYHTVGGMAVNLALGSQPGYLEHDA